MIDGFFDKLLFFHAHHYIIVLDIVVGELFCHTLRPGKEMKV